jgi:UPF0755 protein
MVRRKGGSCGCLALAVLVGAAAAGYWVWTGVQPMPNGKPFFLRIDGPRDLDRVLAQVQVKGVLRNSSAAYLYARIRRNAADVATGTYKLAPGEDVEAVLRSLRSPVKQMVRLPETNWAARSANILERHGVTTAKEYMELVRKPEEFASDAGFPLPKRDSLEGYLFPDTYDLPPLLGARQTILRQLAAFKDKIIGSGAPPKNLDRAVIIGSMVELEVAKDEERPIVAGVIENRLRFGMPLQIDATVLYALGEWRALSYKDLRETVSPYNTYLNKGLPPGPICSPSAASVRAALAPAKHDFLYYVAMPDRRHLFSSTYAGHLSNVAKRRAALANAPQ